MSRVFRLTTPLMHGADIKAFQRDINARRKARSLGTITEDGQYGPDTAAAYRGTAAALGIAEKTIAQGATVGAQRVIHNPKLRNPAELLRARQWAAAEKKREQGGDAAAKLALSYEGIAEKPPSSNGDEGGPIDHWEAEAGMGRGPWCGAFTHHVSNACGAHVSGDIVYTPTGIAHARAATGGYSGFTSDPAKANPGDHVWFNFVGGSVPEHTGVFVRFKNGETISCDGNTSGPGGNQANGGQVNERNRPQSQVLGYGHVRYGD